MRRRLEAALPLLVLIGFAITAVLVNLLLTNAQDQGVDALEEVVTGEVAAVARTRDQELESSFRSAGPLLDAFDFELTVGSERDRSTLSTLLGDVTSSLPFGFFLVDAQGTVTEGFGLLDHGAVGQPLDRIGFNAADVAVRGFPGAILPVAPGLTTEQPATASVYPVESMTGAPGALVIEQPVGPDTDLVEEFRQLGRGETGEFLYYDDRGSVIAATDASLVGVVVDDEALIGARAGLQRRDGKVVIVQDVPTGTGGWHVAFRQDIDEFEGGLARPLESVGQILILALLGAGFILTVLLYRRLRAARAEQERLQHLSEAQQELISIVSHELRTPVAGVLGFLETTLDHWDGMDDADRQRAVSRAAVNARRLQAMTRDVLDTQTVESGRLVHVMEPLDLAAEVRTAVEAAQELDQERTFEVRVPDQGVWVSGDADRLQQVLANLLDNARKSSPAVEPIEVELNVRGGEAEVAVIDHGAGIEDEALERIFDKFVRGRDEGVTGTGLGLYISRQILDAHGGSIWAESEGGGATFRFSLPVRTAPEVASVD